jgi:hypothetical protein
MREGLRIEHEIEAAQGEVYRAEGKAVKLGEGIAE